MMDKDEARDLCAKCSALTVYNSLILNVQDKEKKIEELEKRNKELVQELTPDPNYIVPPRECMHMGKGHGPILKVTFVVHEGREITWVQIICSDCGTAWHGDLRPGGDIDPVTKK